MPQVDFEALFHKKITPLEKSLSFVPEREEIERKIKAEKQYFLEKMSADDWRRFQALEILYRESSNMEKIDIFSRGYVKGLAFMREALTVKKA